ncbi:tetratricopeptide repeat protein [Sphaerothrix gracilis]|uniref:tetratricopeptide repeat protein n=1 Tax=Sphaerothrix gracilis TaxID=3151835 RepID=UPI0031FDA6BA
MFFSIQISPVSFWLSLLVVVLPAAGCQNVTLDSSDELTASSEVQPLADFDNTQTAIAAYQTQIEANPDNAEAYWQLGQAYAKSQQPAKAADTFRQVVRLEPDNVDAFFQLGLAYKRQRNFNDAVTAFNRVLQLDADYPEARSQLNESLYRLRQRDASGGN